MDHILSELSTMTHASWVALHGMPHSFVELDKAVVHVISLINFEIASKYYISDSFVDYDSYSISSQGILPTVVDIMVI